jgi:hypothetical protein
MSRKTKSLQRWSELANPTLKFLGLHEVPRHSDAATVSASLGAVGALAAAFLMREPLGRLSRGLLAEGTAIVEHLSMAELLSVVGLERRRSALSTVAPAVGALVAGTLVGALAADWVRTWSKAYSPTVGIQEGAVT